MALDLNEEATLTLRMDTKEADNDFTVLNDRAKDLKQTLKEIERDGGKGSEEWKKYKNELADVQKQTQALKKDVDLTTLTYGQLGNLVKDLNKELRGLKPGTEEFIAATKRLGEAEKQLSGVKKEVDDIKKGGEDLGQPTMWNKVSSGVGIISKAFSAFILLGVVQYLVDGFKMVIGAFSGFEDAAQSLSAVTGLTGKELEYMKDEAKKTGPQFGMTASEMLAAYEKMGSAKPELLAQKELLAATTKEAIILAKAGKIDLTEATKATAESLNQFGQKADQARRFVNVMASAVKEGSDEISGISSALKASGSVANAASLSFEQTNAVLASLSSQAIKGEQAGTMMRNVLIKLMAGADDTNPKIVGLDKALENLGKQNLNTAELAKKFGTENVVAAQHIVTHREEITALTGKMTGTNSAYEQAAINMNTFSERVKQGTAIVNGYAVIVGEKLAPYVSEAIGFLIGIADNLDVVSGSFTGMGDIMGDVVDIFKTIIGIIFPNFNAGSLTIRGVMQGVGVVLQTVVSVVRIFTSSLIVLLEAFQAVGSGAKGLVLFLSGDFAGAGKAFDETRQHGVKIKDTFTKTFSDIGDGYKKVFADKPKEVLPAAVAANKATAAAIEEAVTGEAKKGSDKRSAEQKKADTKAVAERKKHLDDVAKANEKALDDLAKLEEQNHIARIKSEEGRDIAKLQAARDREAEAIMKGLQSQELKDRQIAALDEKLQQDISKVHEQHVEKRKKAEEDAAQKRLEVLKNVAKLEQDAEMALLDWKEINARGNAQKLTEIARERAETTLRITLNQLKAEEEAEKAKIEKDIQDQDLKGQALDKLDTKYNTLRENATQKTAAEIAKIEQELQDKKKELWSNASSAFGALLKGDLNAFVEHSAKIFKGEQEGWQKKLQGNMETYAAIGQMASQAAQFLADLAQKRADKAIAEAKRARDEQVKILDEQVAREQAEIDKLEAEKQRIKAQSADTVEEIRSSSEKAISDMESQYRQLSAKEEKDKIDKQLSEYQNSAESKRQEATDTANELIFQATQEANKSIEQIQKLEKETIRAAENEKNERIDKAEATRDAEIAAINKKADLDSATRAKLLAEAESKFSKEKSMAEQEAQFKMDQAKLEADRKISLAKNESQTKIDLANLTKDAQLKAIDAMQQGNDKAAREILLKANQDTQEKIKLSKEQADKAIADADREKREKLKKLEQENATRVQAKIELENQIADANEEARQTEIEQKRAAWKSQQRADIASAAIAGALATIKALASGFFPLNLVFAAVTAGLTIAQIAKIKSQPEPQFRHGGLMKGSSHGVIYGDGGMAIVDRATGQERGEMEGDEAIISKEQTRANWGLISRMLDNARTPGRRHSPVDRAPIALRDGGLLEPKRYGEMYLFGSAKRKAEAEAKMQAQAAEMDAKKAADEAAASAAAAGGTDATSGGFEGGAENQAEAKAAQEEAQRQGKMQLQLLQDIVDAVGTLDQNQSAAMDSLANRLSSSVDAMGVQVSGLNGSIMEVKGAVNAVEGATHQVKDAVYGTNAQGKLDQLISAISSLGG